jgi:hypothetical protein
MYYKGSDLSKLALVTGGLVQLKYISLFLNDKKRMH